MAFWPLPSSSKLLLLTEGRSGAGYHGRYSHNAVILRLLADPNTVLEPDGSRWVAYSRDPSHPAEALEIETRSAAALLLLGVYSLLAGTVDDGF